MRWVDEVVAFWFEELQPKDWWGGSARIDETIRTRFGALHDDLLRAPPQLSALAARDHLAAVLVFDQFSRNLFRDSAAAFAADPLALSLTLAAIDRGLDRTLGKSQRQFLYMPLMHSEDPAMQERSLLQFDSLDDPDALRSARDHHDTIARFGRFPYRNVVLGRASSDAELAFLAAHPKPR